MAHSILDVVERGMCIGCGACTARTEGAVPIEISDRGVFAVDLEGLDDRTINLASRVCPFSDDSKNEDQIGSEKFQNLPYSTEVGRYLSAYAGRLTDEGKLLQGSSGGVTSWLLGAALQAKMVDAVVHVGVSDSGDSLYEYTISNSVEDIWSRRKSLYYATTMAGVLQAIRGDGRRYALVGVPCYIRAVRALADEMPVYASQLKLFVGIVCGHLKSQFFAESLGWQAGIEPSRLGSIDFRVKNPHQKASAYDYEATSIDGERRRKSTSDAIDGVWGYGAFQPDACNFCDDVFAETADVVLGDAWLPEYDDEWRGTNVIVTRNALVEDLLLGGVESGDLELDPLTVERAAASQAGNFRHRRDGLRVRLEDDKNAGLSVPQKRVSPGVDHVSSRRADLIRQRRRMSSLSLEKFARARAEGRFKVYGAAMRKEIAVYRRLDKGVVLGAVAGLRRTAIRLRSRLIKLWKR